MPASETEEEEEPVTAQQSSVATLSDEPAGEDFPGANSNGHETPGLVAPGTVSTGHLTRSLDRNYGLTGDYWYLDTQPGHSYRVEVKFGDNPRISTGGSAWNAFVDPDRDEYPEPTSCCDSNHNRDDGATFLHFTHSNQSREKNTRYMVKVAAFDLYNTGTAVYNGPYEITLTDITGVRQMVNTFSGGDPTYGSGELLDPPDGDSVDFATKLLPAPIRTATRSTASRSGSTTSAQRARFQTSRSTRIAVVVPARRCATWRSRTASSSRPSAGTLRRPTPSSPPTAPTIPSPPAPTAGSCSWTWTMSSTSWNTIILQTRLTILDRAGTCTVMAREETAPPFGLPGMPRLGSGSGRRRTRCGHCVDTRLLPQRTG